MKNQSQKKTLADLVYPLSLADFLNHHWPQKPYVTHSLNESIKSLTQLPFLKSLDALLNSWPNLVSAHLPDLRDESSAIDITPENARKLFSNKMALLFNNVQNISPELQLWLKILSQELGLPKSTYGRCLVYATPEGKGTAAHFDQNVNFILQIHGIKKWYIEENTSVENPTQRLIMGQNIDPELASYTNGDWPLKMSKSRQEIILKPGSMLFVPQGYWHSTEATGEAMSLNFTFNQPTWIDLFTMALRSRLLLSPDWREFADGVNSLDPEIRALAIQKFEHLLIELKDDLPNWNSADILAATEGSSDDEPSS